MTTSGVQKNYTYDAAGNVTNDGVHTYQYDAENRIVSVDGGSTAQYSYDQNNRRIKKAVGSATTHYVWEGSQVVAEHDGTTGTVLTDYIYSGSRMIAKFEAGAVRYLLGDRLSVRLVLDASGNVTGRQAHLPYGEDFAASGAQEKHHFSSYEKDGESGIDYAINRGYSAGHGRFLSADPYRASGYEVDPQSWNRYSYGRNNPVDFADPLGLLISAVNGGSLGTVSVFAGDGWISADSAGFALLWGYLIGGGSSGGGGGAATSNDTGGGTQPQPSAEEIALKKGIEDAKAILENASPECKALFNGKDPAEVLKELETMNRIKIGNTYQYYDDSLGKNVKEKFDVGEVGIAPQVKGALGVTYPMIFINQKGAFITGKVIFLNGSQNASTYFGVKPEQVQAFIVLHELVHAAGRRHPRGTELDFNTEIRDKCFKKK